MRPSRWLLLVLQGLAVHGCGSTPASSSPGVAPDPTAAPMASPRAAPTPGRQRVRLAIGQPQTLDGLEVVLSGYEIERIEGDPEGHYASGMGVSLHLRVGGETVVLSELPSGYDSVRTAETRSHRVELVDHGTDASPWAEIDLVPNERP